MAYVYGNTVRKEELDIPKHQKEKKQVSSQVRKNRYQAKHMSKGYVLFLTVAATIALVLCVQYLQLQSEITDRSNRIVALQRELEELEDNNTTEYHYIMSSMNLEEIREKAMNDLGMVYAEEDQMIEYTSPSGSVVTQYEKIPESGIVTDSN